MLTHPLVALAIFVSGPFLVYFTGLFEYAMRNHTAHLVMSVHFLLAGYLFYEVLIGIDPLPKRPPSSPGWASSCWPSRSMRSSGSR